MRFLCDAMLGGLAKWLRAAGHDAYYAREGTDVSDRRLVERAMEEERVLLTADGGFLERAPVRDGRVGFSMVPQHLPVEEQLRLVVGRFGLRWHASRCMKCGGRARGRTAGVRRGPGPVRRRARPSVVLPVRGLRTRLLARLALGEDLRSPRAGLRGIAFSYQLSAVSKDAWSCLVPVWGAFGWADRRFSGCATRVALLVRRGRGFAGGGGASSWLRGRSQSGEAR